MSKLSAICVAIVAGVCLTAHAAGNDDIVSHITAGGTNTIVQPQALARLLVRPAAVSTPVSQTSDAADSGVEENQTATVTHAVKTAGFRVQVFSDNRPAAKGEARSKGRAISGRFPNMRTYVTYNSPYWRLKVGDFRTKREAEHAAEEIRQAFPAYSREIRVVADKISVGAN